MKPIISDRELYVNSDKSRIVPKDSPEAAYLLVRAGGIVPAHMVEIYERVTAAERAESEAIETAALAEPPETKRVKGPTERKKEGTA